MSVHEDNKTVQRKKLKRPKKRSVIKEFFKLAAFSLLLVYSVATIISTQADIAEQKVTIEKLKAEITEARQENDEYLRLLGSKNEEEYMLTAAIQRGYAYPREIRFYPKNNLE